jgi:glycosyltransferase involved in cell wall biosynthesis
MRVLIGMPEKGSRGGPAACEPPFVDELRRLGHDVEEEIYAYAQTNSGSIRRISRVRKTARRFHARLRRGNFDIVHLNTSFDTKALLRDAVVISCLPSKGARVFLKFHGSDARLLKTSNPLLRSLGRYLLSRVDGIGVLSSEERGNFLNAGVLEQKIFVVGNVINNAVGNVVEKERQSSDPDFRAKWNLPEDVPLLLFIGRFIEAKGLMDVIHACKLLRHQDREFVLLCVGDGPARASAETEVNRLGLGSHVRFVGYVPEQEASGFYANSTMLVFPTYHYEGFPMVIFNAAAAGLPIITTRIRAAADYLKEPDNCLWVKPNRPDMLVENIIRLLENEELRSRMRANNRKLVDRFSAEKVTQEYVAAYSKMLSQARGQANFIDP